MQSSPRHLACCPAQKYRTIARQPDALHYTVMSVSFALLQAAREGIAVGRRVARCCTKIFLPKLSVVQNGSETGKLPLEHFFTKQAPENGT